MLATAEPRIAILDSGVNVRHPHIGNVVCGCAVTEEEVTDDYTDVLGHGTAVAAAIHEKAPDAGLLIVKIFHRSLSTTISQLIRGIEWSLDRGVDVLNLSLGTTNPDHRSALQTCIDRANTAGVSIVSALQMGDKPCFPGSMKGVIGVSADARIPRHEVRINHDHAIGSPFPRPIPGLPVERNLSGISFAVANVSGFLCAQLAAGSRNSRP